MTSVPVVRGTIIASIRGTKPLERIYNARFPRARLNGTEVGKRKKKKKKKKRAAAAKTEEE